MVKLTRLQREALKRICIRIKLDSKLKDYIALRRKVEPGPGCIMVPYFNTWLGVEPDGYTHS